MLKSTCYVCFKLGFEYFWIWIWTTKLGSEYTVQMLLQEVAATVSSCIQFIRLLICCTMKQEEILIHPACLYLLTSQQKHWRILMKLGFIDHFNIQLLQRWMAFRVLITALRSLAPFDSLMNEAIPQLVSEWNDITQRRNFVGAHFLIGEMRKRRESTLD